MKRSFLFIFTIILILSNYQILGQFKINVEIKRPAILKYPYSNLRNNNPSSLSYIRMVPASFQMVEVRWNGMTSICYTDSKGTLDGYNFDYGGSLPFNVSLTVRGSSSLGIKVGNSSILPHEFLEVVYDYNWGEGPLEEISSTEIDYPDINLGCSEDGKFKSFSHPDFKAASLMELLTCIYQEFDLTEPSKWNINSTYAATIGSSQPWAYWNIVHMNAAISTENILYSAPHELGHILYNVNHSDKPHYDTDDWMDYLHEHNACSDLGYHFGNYEGYAHAFRSLFWRHHAQSLDSNDYAYPEPICDKKGIELEGNINKFYSYGFAGFPMERSPESLHDWTIHRIGANEYAFPPTYELFEIVSNVFTEDIIEMWNNSMNQPKYTGTYNGTPKFWGSKRFKCMIKDSLLASTDVLSSEFVTLDCSPGISNIVNAVDIGPTTVEVEFTPAEPVDGYFIIMTPESGDPIITEVDVSDMDVLNNMKQVISVPRYFSYQIEVETLFNGTIRKSLPFHLSGIGFLVNTTDDLDDGIADRYHCSLREAINEANADPRKNEIHFHRSRMGLPTIQPLSPLPPITNPVIIDGYSRIEIDGSEIGQANGLEISAGNSTVKGLIINNCGAAGILLHTNGGNTIRGNYLGTKMNGTEAKPNHLAGVHIIDVPDNYIGGYLPEHRNIISGNTLNGVWIEFPNAIRNLIHGNYIGVSADGLSPLANGDFGVKIQNASQNRIGSITAGKRNIISANGWHGILISQCGAGSNNVVQGNYIGTDKNGSIDLGNTGNGITILNSENVLIGGGDVGAGNLISGNQGHGISIWDIGSKNNKVQGNIIGLDDTGKNQLGNKAGINIGYASSNIIGGTKALERNIISGNRLHGVGLIFNSAINNQILGNFIGTDISGKYQKGNGYELNPLGSGISIYRAPNNTIGGISKDHGNIISGNYGHGVWLAGSESSGNVIRNNKIGTTFDGSGAIPNVSDGVCIDRDSEDIKKGAANHTNIYMNSIAFNGGAGILVKYGENNKISKNSIYLNNGLGIDLSGDGVTLNDKCDDDTGPNKLLNYPVLKNAFSEWKYIDGVPGLYTTVDVSLNSIVETEFILQLFKSDDCDLSGFGEGQIFTSNENITTNPFCRGMINDLVVSCKPGDYLTATVIDPSNNTSEFSRAVLVEMLNTSSTTIVSQEETESSETIIPNGLVSVTFSSQWPGSDVVMTLISPSGREITRDTDENDIEHKNGDTFEYFTIVNPESGEWIVELYGLDVEDEGEEVSLTITGAPTQPMGIMTIDIKPGDDNDINCTNYEGVIPVAILTTEDFDATSIDHSTVRFGKYGIEAIETHVKNGIIKRHEEDVDNDGDIDLVFHFRHIDTKLDCNDELAVMTGVTYDGYLFTGADIILNNILYKSGKAVANSIPNEFALMQNYPNPFNPTTSISYSIPKEGYVTLSIYDMLGNKVACLVNDFRVIGNYSIMFDANKLASGIYFYRLQAGDFIQTKKMLLMK